MDCSTRRLTALDVLGAHLGKKAQLASLEVVEIQRQSSLLNEGADSNRAMLPRCLGVLKRLCRLGAASKRAA